MDSPPLKDFRVNSILAGDQGVKVCPVLNVSLPEEESFNSNVNELLLEKVYMSNARRFGLSVCEAGFGAIMSKFDLVDAYKNVLVKLFDLRLQGFAWLSKFFFECRQIFGAKTAVQNFDNHTRNNLSVANFPGIREVRFSYTQENLFV